MSVGTSGRAAGGQGSRVWVWRVLAGVVTALVGVLILVWPVRTLLIIGVLFGIELVVLGILRVVAASRVPKGARFRGFGLVLGILTVAAGVFCFLRPGASLAVLAIFFAAGFIADGVIDLLQVPGAGLTGRSRALTVLSGVISIVAGIVVAVFPGASLVLLVQISGFVLIAVGIIGVVIGLGSRSR